MHLKKIKIGYKFSLISCISTVCLYHFLQLFCVPSEHILDPVEPPDIRHHMISVITLLHTVFILHLETEWAMMKLFLNFIFKLLLIYFKKMHFVFFLLFIY